MCSVAGVRMSMPLARGVYRRVRSTVFTDEENVMQLQVALDVLDLPSALTLANQVSEHVDILELGTPLV